MGKEIQKVNAERKRQRYSKEFQLTKTVTSDIKLKGTKLVFDL